MNLKDKDNLRRVTGDKVLPHWLKQRLKEIAEYARNMPLIKCQRIPAGWEEGGGQDGSCHPDECGYNARTADGENWCINCQRDRARVWAIEFIANGCDAMHVPEKIHDVRIYNLFDDDSMLDKFITEEPCKPISE